MLSRLNVFCQRVSQPLKLNFTSRKYSSIPEFYRDRSVLVTGATGFLGQGLVEKLLRSCPDIGRIYICVRPDKDGKTEQKYRRFLQNKVFKILRENNSDFHTKIVPFKGDITEDNFGMNDALLLAEMTEKVSVIFHCAADIRLKPSLRKHDDAYLLKHENQIISTGVTYTFCKEVAENVVLDRNYGTKTAVFRSCFISPALLEPFPYWMYGNAGYVLIVKNITKGIISFLRGKPSNPVENLPVDMIVNSLISVGWYLGTGRHGDTEPLVANVVSSTDNPVTLRDLENTVREVLGKKRNSGFKVISNRLVYVVLTSPAIVKAFLNDIVVVLKGEQPKDYQIWVYQHSDDLIRGQIQSRHKSQTKYNVWIQYENTDTTDPVKDYHCICPSGKRTIGMCAHVASILYYLCCMAYEPSLEAKRFNASVVSYGKDV